ncbi:putative peptide import ATP-binding protein [Nymphon striatum]|nr:putative peptide import ATP-binding protein [Nymphon striatum]
MGLVPNPPGKVTSGSIKLDGAELVGLEHEELRKIRGKDIGMIFQEPMTSLNPVFTVGEQIAETVKLHENTSQQAAKARAVEMLKAVEIPEAEVRAKAYPHQLSGGMRQRVMIAMALACSPRLLIADEPTTALDTTVQAQIFDLLQNLQDETGTAIILITHDMGLISCVPHLSTNPSKTRETLMEIPGVVPPLTELGKACSFAPRCNEVLAKCKLKQPELLQTKEHHLTACRVKLGNSVISELEDEQLRAARSQFQIVFQDPYSSLDPRKRAGEIVREPLDLMDIGDPSDRDSMVAKLFDQVGLRQEQRHLFPHQFSGGQRQRISLARALSTKPDLIVCDEPVSALDVAIQAQILNLMVKLQEELGLTYLFISHDLGVIQHICNEIAVMYLGQIVEQADRVSLFKNPKHPYTKALLAGRAECAWQ